MDQKAIGDYLKRLRLRAKYTQSELGERLNVTDKAISRWESGMGMPELGNLMEISKLFGVTVDDILNCNEAVFSASEEEDPEIKGPLPEKETALEKSASQNSENVLAPLATDKAASAERACSAASAPSRKFVVVLLMSYFSFGIFAASFQPAPVNEFMVPYILISIFVIFSAALCVIEKFIPKKIYNIVSVCLQSVLIVLCIILGRMIFAYVEGGVSGIKDSWRSDNIAPFSAATAMFVFAALFAMRLLYILRDMQDDAKIRRIFDFSAIGVSAVAVVLTLVCSSLTTFFEYETGEANIALMVCGVTALVFALRQLFSNGLGLDILNMILFFGYAVVCLVRAVLGQFEFVESDVSMWTFYRYPFLCALALLSPAALSVSWLLEGRASDLFARRLTAVISIILLIPMMYYGFDVFALNILLGHSGYAVIAWLRIAVFVAALVYYLYLCEIDKLFKKSGKKRSA